MKRTIEVTKLNVITLSENKKKGHANCNSKSSNTVQSGNPIIKGKTKTRLLKKTIWIIVIGSLLALLALIGGIYTFIMKSWSVMDSKQRIASILEGSPVILPHTSSHHRSY